MDQRLIKLEPRTFKDDVYKNKAPRTGHTINVIWTRDFKPEPIKEVT